MKPTPVLRGTLNEMVSAILSSCGVAPGALDYDRLRTLARDELLAAWRNGGFVIGNHPHQFTQFDDDRKFTLTVH